MMLVMQGCHASPSTAPKLEQKRSADAPCFAEGRDKVQSEVFSNASNPEALWALATLVACPHGAIEEDRRGIREFIVSPISYITESFPAEDGPLDRDELIATPDDMAELIVSSGFYAEDVNISISRPDRALLKISGEVCTLQLDVQMLDNSWLIQGARNQCD